MQVFDLNGLKKKLALVHDGEVRFNCDLYLLQTTPSVHLLLGELLDLCKSKKLSKTTNLSSQFL